MCQSIATVHGGKSHPGDRHSQSAGRERDGVTTLLKRGFIALVLVAFKELANRVSA